MALNVQGFRLDICSVCSGLQLCLTVEMKKSVSQFVIQHENCFKTSCLCINYSSTKAAQPEPVLALVELQKQWQKHRRAEAQDDLVQPPCSSWAT